MALAVDLEPCDWQTTGSDGDLLYYVLQRSEGALYAINTTLSEEEARQYGREGETVPVTAVCVWTDFEQMENFRQFLSINQGDPNSPFRALIEDMQAGRVNALELTGEHLRTHLRQYQRQGFVAVGPGPNQRVVRIDEFLEDPPTRSRLLEEPSSAGSSEQIATGASRSSSGR